jgi:hypothetical protein
MVLLFFLEAGLMIPVFVHQILEIVILSGLFTLISLWLHANAPALDRKSPYELPPMGEHSKTPALAYPRFEWPEAVLAERQPARFQFPQGGVSNTLSDTFQAWPADGAREDTEGRL